ncbi:hypothetical protein SLS60_009690 [Paraconiothyrium brasiliense]|uniref:Uncharacterized protein n=1 Tax=Paraconiothyrium brasiliense TaxID=300254 RepID=A0ABR3QV13_9PLEO
MSGKTIIDSNCVIGFTPKFAVGCRRITPGEPYLKAIQKENVQVHFTPVVKIVPEGVVGGDGVTRVVDSIICATGFDVSFTPRFPIIGRNGVALAERWRDEPNAYFGVTVPDMPNLVMQGGPPTPVQNGTPFGAFHTHANYALQVIKKMQRDNIRLLQPKRTVTEAFNRHAQDYLMNTVFADSCRAWYKNNETGRITAIWPGSALQYKELLDSARWEDYEIEYRDKDNMFAFLGNGLVKEHVNPELDITYYLNVSNIDPRWLKEVQGQK